MDALGQDENAVGIQHADEERGEEGAPHRSHTADHHHHEGLDDDRGVHDGRQREAGHLQGPAQPRQERTQDEDAREEAPLIDAERGDHLAVLRRGTDQHAPARAVEEHPQGERHQRTEADDREIVGRKELTRYGHRAREPGCRRSRFIVGAPEVPHGIGYDQHEGESQQELVQLGCAIHAPEQEHLDESAQRGDDAGRQDHRRVECRRAQGQRRGERVGQVRGEHVEGAVGEIDDARDAEDEREARRDEEEEHRVCEAAQELDEEERH